MTTTDEPNYEPTIQEEVEQVKAYLGFQKSNDDLTDQEIKMVAREFGKREDNRQSGQNYTLEITPNGYQTILLVVLYCFPLFYEKWKLSQWN